MLKELYDQSTGIENFSALPRNIKVTCKGSKGPRGSYEGILIAFDKHMNLVRMRRSSSPVYDVPIF
jgi:hypothetical protein